MNDMKNRLFRLALCVTTLCLFQYGHSYHSLDVEDKQSSTQSNYFNVYYHFSEIKTDYKTGKQYWELKLNKDKINLNSLKDAILTITSKNTGIRHILRVGKDAEINEDIIVVPKPNDSDCLIKAEYNVAVNGLKMVKGGTFSIGKNLCVLGDTELAKRFGIVSEIYRIDYENKVIKGVPLKTSVGSFIRGISFKKYKFLIHRQNGTVLNFKDKLATGDEIEFIVNKKTKYKFSIAVMGDLTGKGNITKKGIKICEKHVIGEAKLKQPFLAAADLNGDGKVDSADLILMQGNFPLPYE